MPPLRITPPCSHQLFFRPYANPQSGDLNVPVAYSEAIKWWEKVGFCASQCGQHWGSSGQHWGSSAPEGDHSTPPLSLCRRPLRTLHQLCITSA